MVKNSKIEWTDHTFNPWRGCSKVSPACSRCYAMELVNRYGGDFLGQRKVASEAMWREPLKWNREAGNLGIRKKVFCASLSDVFEDYTGQMVHHSGTPMWLMRDPNGHPYQWGAGSVLDSPLSGRALHVSDVRRRLCDLFEATPNLDWLVLTKRPENILRFMYGCKGKLESALRAEPGTPEANIWHHHNVWFGTTVENQEQANKRIPDLLKCRNFSPVLFLSMEPLLENVELSDVTHRSDAVSQLGKPAMAGIDWVIVGGESGKGARSMKQEWAESLRDQCRAVNVPFFFKQGSQTVEWPKFKDFSSFPEGLQVREFPSIGDYQDCDCCGKRCKVDSMLRPFELITDDLVCSEACAEAMNDRNVEP